MKFDIKKSDLQEALQTAITAIPNKSTLQILNNYSLRLEGNILEICATDLNLGVRTKLEVNGERDGEVVINARKFSDLIKALSDPAIETISIDVQDYLARIKWSERGQASIMGFDAGDFPPFPEVEGDSLNFAASELAFLVEKTAFATSNDSVRMNLNGVFFEADNGKVSMVATDGHRMGRASIDQEGATLASGIIIQPKVLQQILRIAKSEDIIEIRTTETHVLFSTGSTQIISKLYEGPYPNYRNVIPQNFERTVQANCAELQGKVKSILPMANPRTHQIRLHMNGNVMELSATDPDVGGECREALAITHNGEGNFSMGFDGRYFSEILGMCKSEEVILKMNSPLGACIIEPVGEDLNYSFLLMPSRLVD
ncbi:DNA polymerase III, beta subunit [Fibrobacter sp. UWH9]|uniref:DNA polymerase III subunit beta n=1 Tax=unclassified Fibrobacter TaxID=2634177 RepID=UPI00091D7E0F|nr:MULTISPECIES: DNA polymerase III subunit beta [Fibrobacter]MDO4946649.1 DNA polymerase III subunit beta [Fibrobacter sp.]MCL4102842.1 Beta sliding clamp [Fibrobacter succinogenes]OWV04231.1 DNA polymerase III subunit beta [Fibrobacter sp. UWH3]OWV12509.1 DNA polymerase III subunit beta [Fibrobacter sp. UWH1]SHH60481.1 DNA polymerase III, beta subunit [Fibrobacter sp. UWH9]